MTDLTTVQVQVMKEFLRCRDGIAFTLNMLYRTPHDLYWSESATEWTRMAAHAAHKLFAELRDAA